MLALEGIRVFDMTRVLAGPFCTQILGDLGADVIKIEQPGVGDVTRTWGPPFEKDAAGKNTDESAYYLSCNRNKRSLTLDFTKPEGLEIAKKIIMTCDVFVENFKTGTLAKYGLSYEDIKKIKPDIIYCSITGFGHTGPYADRPGYDFQIQGMSGLMSLIGDPHGAPMRAGISISDLGAGVYSAAAILAALFQHARTGQGQFIDMALLDTTMSLLSFAAQSFLLDGNLPPRVGNAHPNIVPYGAFQASDGFVVITIGTDTQFQKFCKFVAREDLISHPHYVTNEARVMNRDEVINEIGNIVETQTKAYWMENLDKLDIPIGPVNTLAEAFENPQVQARDIAHPFQNGLKTVASPLHLLNSEPMYKRRPPHLGEHSVEILQALISLDEIKKLKKCKII